MVPQYAAPPMSVIVCDCPRNRRCPACIDQALMWFGGIACSRGIRWAEDVARRRPGLLQRPWPGDSERATALARGKVGDLSDDPHVVDRLAASVAEYAGRRWLQLQAGA